MSLFPVDNNTRYTGVDIDETARITKLKSAGGGSRQLINGGVYLIEPAALAGLPFRPGDKVSLEDDLLPQVLATGKRLVGHTVRGRFIDIGVPEDYVRAAGMLR